MRALFLVVTALCAPSAWASRVILAGSGYLPRPALEKFIDWGGGKDGEYLVVIFSSVFHEEIYRKVEKQFDTLDIPKERLKKSPRFEEMSADKIDPTAEWPVGKYLEKLEPVAKKKFLKQIESATAIYFAGGDQNKHMAVLADPDIASALSQKIASGYPVAGGSAGLHVLTNPMIAGDDEKASDDPYAVLTSRGFGALENILADSHFLERRRTNRMKGALRRFRRVAIGVGIDQNSALVVDGDVGTAMGKSGLEIYVKSARRPSEYWNVTLEPGASFDLKRRRRVNPPAPSRR